MKRTISFIFSVYALAFGFIMIPIIAVVSCIPMLVTTVLPLVLVLALGMSKLWLLLMLLIPVAFGITIPLLNKICDVGGGMFENFVNWIYKKFGIEYIFFN